MKLFVILTCVLMSAAVGAQAPAGEATLARVRIPVGVLANGQPLPEGSYDVRLTTDAPTPRAGQSPDAQRWVEFLAGGAVAGKEIAEVVRDDDLPSEGASTQATSPGVRVDLLKGGEFVRVSVRRADTRYLIYLPVAR